MTKIIPAILSLLDYIPLKGYRTVVFTGIFFITMLLSKFGVVPVSVADMIMAAVVPMIGYFAGAHEEPKA